MNAPDMWAVLSAQPFPFLHEISPMERDRFVLLDAYLHGCLEEWCASGGQLSARSIVLLDDCARSITRRWQLLDGEGQYYFGQFRRLARRILRRVDVNEAHRQIEREMAVLLDEERCLDKPCVPSLALDKNGWLSHNGRAHQPSTLVSERNQGQCRQLTRM